MRPEPTEVLINLASDATLPSYATEASAGMDICSAESVSLAPLERKLVRTGVRMAIPAGYEGQVRPRSGLALKKGLSIVNSPGTIDSDFRGEVGIILINLGEDVVEIQKGERIAQMVICPVVKATLRIVGTSELGDTARGGGGFGSTG